MGHAEGCSMLYLEARCLLITRGAGSQGVQNGSISCIALPESLPGGVQAVLAENLLAAMLDLEVAAGNDALASHSAIRKTAKLMLQFIPGADFIFSGYSAIPSATICSAAATSTPRISTITTCSSAICRSTAACARSKSGDAGRAPPGCPGHPGDLRRAGLPARHRCRGRGGGDSRTAARICPRAMWWPIWQPPMVPGRRSDDSGGGAGAQVARLHPGGGEHSGDGSPARGRRLSPALGDLRSRFPCAERDQRPERLRDPGTGYRVGGARWEEIQALPQVRSPRDFIADQLGAPVALAELGPARPAARTRWWWRLAQPSAPR